MTGTWQDLPVHHDTIIIGAGISGLACAAKLLESLAYSEGKKTLLVLEARERIGGRIESVCVNGNRLDTGANWVHGIGTPEKPNPLVEILPNKRSRELSLSVSFHPPSNSAGQAVVGTKTGQNWISVDSDKSSLIQQEPSKDLVMLPEISSKLFGSLWTLIASLHASALSTSKEVGKETTILKAITQDQQFKRAFKQIPKEYHQAVRAMPQFVEVMEAGPLDAQSAEHNADHPGMSLLEYALHDFDGDQVFLQDGYTPVVEEVARNVIKKELVKFGAEVQHVLWDADPIVISTNGGTYTAKRVVCTLSLGLLQHHQTKPTPENTVRPLFVPALPPKKSEAITSIGFGTLDKVFMVYSTPWWVEEPYKSILKKGLVHRSGDDSLFNPDEDPSDPDSFWGFTDELSGIEIDEDGSTQPGVRGLSVINLHALTGFPVLSCFTSCANATHVESLSNSAASMIVHRSLTKWLGREPPMPDAVHVTRWAQDEYSRGSYSHMIAGLSETRHREEFGKPIVNEKGAELRFAGEHTSINHFATVHGALLSGRREAEAILKSEASGV